MPDYGHELGFGSFVMPQHRRPQDAVALTQLSARGFRGVTDEPAT